MLGNSRSFCFDSGRGAGLSGADAGLENDFKMANNAPVDQMSFQSAHIVRPFVHSFKTSTMLKLTAPRYMCFSSSTVKWIVLLV